MEALRQFPGASCSLLVSLPSFPVLMVPNAWLLLLPLPFFLFLILLSLPFQPSLNKHKQSVYKTLCPKRAYCPKQIDAPVFRHIPSCVVQSPGFLPHPDASGMPLLQQPGPRPQVARLCLLVAPFSKVDCCVLTSRPFPLSWQCSVLDVGDSLLGRASHCHSPCHRQPATLFGHRGSGHVALPKWDTHLYQKPQELRPRRQ